MKQLQRFVSLLLTLCLVLSMIPAQPLTAKAAETDTVSVEEIRFYSDSSSASYVVLDNTGATQSLDFASGENPYKFEITMSNPEEVGHVYVTCIDQGIKKYLDAVYNESTGRFVTNGYFDENNKALAPREISVEYSLKVLAPGVGSDVDWDTFQDAALENATVENTNSENGSSSGLLDFSGTGGSLADSAIDYAVTTMFDKTSSEINDIRSHYETATNVLSYVVPGIDDSKYYAYLDYSDPSSVNMLIDDGLDVGSKAVELSMSAVHPDSGEYYKLSELSQNLSTASTTVSLASDMYNIAQDMDTLREDAYTAYHLSDGQRESVLADINELETNQAFFAIAVTAIPILVTGGMATGPAVTLFTSMIGVMASASDLIFDQRIANVKSSLYATDDWKKTNNTEEDDTVPPPWWWTWDDVYTLYYPDSQTLFFTPEEPDLSRPTNHYRNYMDDVRYVVFGEGITDAKYALPSNVTDVILPSTLKTITTMPYGQMSMNVVTIPEGVENLYVTCGDNASTFILPSTLKSFPVAPSLVDCDNLSTVYFRGNTSQWETATGDDDSWEADLKAKGVELIMTPSGQYGNTEWWLEERTGTLYLRGGYMQEIPEYSDGTLKYPWRRILDKIQRIEVLDGISNLPANAFRDLPNLTSVSLPDSLTYIGNNAFAGCTALKSITIPKVTSDTHWGDNIFSGCTSLEEAILLGGSSHLGNGMFSGCSALTSISVPETMRFIDSKAFSNCTSLHTITIPKTVISIASDAFEGCTSLKTIHYGSSKTAWESFGCANQEPALSAVKTYESEGVCGQRIRNLEWQNYVFWDFEEDTGRLVIEGLGSMFGYNDDNYSLVCPWEDYRTEIKSVVIKSGVENISAYAFCGCTALTDISISSTVYSIDEGAFINCTALKEIYIPETVGNIGVSVFRGCTALTDAVIDSQIETIENRLFFGCSALTNVTLPDSVEYIDYAAFYDTGLTQIQLPENLRTIGSSAFSDCNELTEIVIPASVSSIGGSAFSYNPKLSKITFEGDAPTVGHGAFESVTANCYYPGGNETWTDSVIDSINAGHFFATLTWAQSCANHDPVQDPAIAATCDKKGLTEGSHCSICGVVLTAQQQIPATGHTEVVINGVDATCTYPGCTETKYCAVCDVIIVDREIIPPKGHSYTDDQDDTCNVCGENRDDTVSPDPDEPTDPSDPADPDEPTDPSDPVDPDEPTDPSDPVDPDEPTDPSDPADPDEPTDPSDPADPDEPTDPSDPADPDEPTDPSDPADPSVVSVPMHRMYDPNSGEHFYTGAEAERDFLVSAGWHYEGVGFNFPEEGPPVYRLYEPVYGEHLYTMDMEEVNKLKSWGWNVEGVAFNSAGEDEVPQYRLHNPNAKRGGYHFTGSVEERDFLISIGWIDEGIGWYSCLE